LVLRFSSTFTMDQILPWVKFGKTGSQGRRRTVGLIKPDTLPPKFQQKAQLHSIHSVHTYRPWGLNWILLQSMSLNPTDYRWTLDMHGYEPVPTLEILKFTTCNCHEDCSDRRCSCNKSGVTCIFALKVTFEL